MKQNDQNKLHHVGRPGSDSCDHEVHSTISSIGGKRNRLLSSSSSSYTSYSIINYLTFAHLIKLLRFLVQKIIIAFSEIINVTFCIKNVLSQMCSNLFCFFHSYPPAILFTINVALFAILLMFVGFYIKVSNHLESTEEWRTFLESFTKLELCIVPIANSTPTTAKVMGTEKYDSMKNYETHSIPISLSIHPSLDLLSSNASILHLSTVMSGKHIGLEGEDSQALINVTLLYKNQWNASLCNQGKLSGCPIIENINGCVHFRAPKNIFPENKHLQHCPLNQFSVESILLDDKIKRTMSRDHILTSLRSSSRSSISSSSSSDINKVYYGSLNWQIIGIDTIYYCRNRPTIRANFNMFLLKPAENVIDHVTRQHLLRTSFFLACFVVVIIMYGACFNHRANKGRTISVSSVDET